MTKLRFLGLLLALTWGAGCSGQGGTAPAEAEESTVTGQVTVNGKKATGGTIVFQPQGREPIETDVRPDGSYSLKTRAGTNIVSVKGAELERAAANRPPQVPYVVQPGEEVIDLAY